jgi:uncharacterized protein YcbK (DUF882 family)
VGGAQGSQHVKGTAADLHTPLPPKELFGIIKDMYDAGEIPSLGYCQLYSWGCHVDSRAVKANNIFNG